MQFLLLDLSNKKCLKTKNFFADLFTVDLLFSKPDSATETDSHRALLNHALPCFFIYAKKEWATQETMRSSNLFTLRKLQTTSIITPILQRHPDSKQKLLTHLSNPNHFLIGMQNSMMI